MKRYITLDMEAMNEHNLNMNEWVLLDNIYFLSNNEYHACYASKDSLRKYLGISNGKIYQIIDKLILEKFIIKTDLGHLKVTKKWINIITKDNNCNENNIAREPNEDALQKMEKQPSKNGDTLQKMENMSPKNGKCTLQKMETKKEYLKGENKERGDIRESDLPDLSFFTDKWNEFAEEFGLQKVLKLTSGRKAKLKKRIKDAKNFYNAFEGVLENVKFSNFLQGQNNKNWKIDFDWIIANDTNYVKVIEGKYNNA